jgi:hypothetical protein
MKEQGRSCGTRIATIVGAVAMALGVAAPAHAIGFEKDGWSATFDGEMHGFGVSGKSDDVGTTKGITETRVVSGWNPSKFNAHFAAPAYEGLKVTGNFQYAANITNGANGSDNVDVRVLDINVSGSFGTLSVGRSWAIFDGSAIVAEEGSGGGGVGNQCLGTSPQVTSVVGKGSCGRMGSGYTWTNFDSRIEYDTPDLGGFSARFGVFDGGSGTRDNTGVAFQNKSPRLEAEATFASTFSGGSFKVWIGALNQKLDVSANSASTISSVKLQGANFGGRVDLGGFALAGNVTNNKGFGIVGAKYAGIACSATDCESLKDRSQYVDASYKLANTRFGASYGTGKQDASSKVGTDQYKAKHGMLYVHHNITPQAVLTLEYDDVKVKNETVGVDVQKYKLLVVGMNFFF